MLMSTEETDEILSGAIVVSAESFDSIERRSTEIQLSLRTKGAKRVFSFFRCTIIPFFLQTYLWPRSPSI